MVSNFNQLPYDGSVEAQDRFDEIFPYYSPVGSDEVIGRQTEPGDWMDRQVEILRNERLGTTDTNQQQGEQ